MATTAIDGRAPRTSAAADSSASEQNRARELTGEGTASPTTAPDGPSAPDTAKRNAVVGPRFGAAAVGGAIDGPVGAAAGALVGVRADSTVGLVGDWRKGLRH